WWPRVGNNDFGPSQGNMYTSMCSCTCTHNWLICRDMVQAKQSAMQLIFYSLFHGKPFALHCMTIHAELVTKAQISGFSKSIEIERNTVDMYYTRGEIDRGIVMHYKIYIL
ncbi:hypothetical protein ACJX0J_031981, partial [Zea mays]